MTASKAANTSAGTLVGDYSVVASADALSASTPLASGQFVFRGSVFSPKYDMPGQKAGNWYLQGSWSITDTSVPAADLSAKYNSHRIEGELKAELPFDPTKQPAGTVDAQLSIPQSLDAGRWTSANGKLIGSARLEGQMNLDVALLPDVSNAQPAP